MGSNDTNTSVSPNNISTETVHNPWDDAIWILTCSFIIFTMQSGFGLLESGMVSRKHEINILVKNIADVLFGGLAFWMFGYAFSFGKSHGTNPFIGFGDFFVDADGPNMGLTFSKFFFQASFSTTATTIVSGSMAERVKLESYCLFSFMNTIIFCLPAHWLWAENGWLKNLGAIDEAGACTVHLVGGVTGLTATIMLKPRSGRFEEGEDKSCNDMGSPTTALLGLFMLWWGWLALNCGSTFGVTDGKWKVAARAAVMTINASVGGGTTAILLSYFTKARKVDVKLLIRGILGSLVSISGLCGWARPWEAILVGAVGSLIACYGVSLLERVRIDDPVGSVSIHMFPAIWAMVAAGIFLEPDASAKRPGGLVQTGSAYTLGVELLATVVVSVWCALMATVILFFIDKTIGLRVSYQEEVLGADIVEHSIGGYSKARRGAVSQENPKLETRVKHNDANFATLVDNLAHLQRLADLAMKRGNDDDEDENDEQPSDDAESFGSPEPTRRVRFQQLAIPETKVEIAYEQSVEE